MDGHTRYCQFYCCSEFRLSRDVVAANAEPPPSLTNRIHPIFAREMFNTITDDEYAKLDLTLRLASRMLLDKRSLKFILTMATGTVHYNHDPDEACGPALTWAEIDADEAASGHKEEDLLRYSPTEVLAQHANPDGWTRMQSWQILYTLKSRISCFEPTKNIPACGLTEVGEPSPLSGLPRASMCRVFIAHNTIWRFLQFGPNGAEGLFNQYFAARTLCHEIAHVVQSCTNGKRPTEVFYENSCCDEAGFQWEQTVFGGVVELTNLGRRYTEHAARDWAPVSETWPSKRHLDRAIKNEKALTFRYNLEDWAVDTRIPWVFIIKMFKDDFWENVAPNIDGPILPDPQIRWVTRAAQPGDTFIDSNGLTQTATETDTLVVINDHEMDEGVPQWVRDTMTDILTTQWDRIDEGTASREAAGGATSVAAAAA